MGPRALATIDQCGYAIMRLGRRILSGSSILIRLFAGR
jgi:hypothetical protein